MSTTTTSRALDLYRGTSRVVGQDRARRQLAVLLERQVQVSQEEWDHSESAIICGWTGTGKTYLVRMMAQLTGLPFADANATQYTETGYAGDDLSQMFLPLLESAARCHDERKHQGDRHPVLGGEKHRESSVLKRDDIEEIAEVAASGVLLLDEFDKWMQRINHHTGRLDVAIQAELLKMIEGSTVYVSDNEDEAGIPFDTSRVLILCAGAFVGLTQQVLRRMEQPSEYVNNEGFWTQLQQEDFIRYGIIPELSGRLNKLVFLRPLTKDDLAQIILQPGGPIDEWCQRFERAGCEWDVPESAVISLCEDAIQRNVGARGVDAVLWIAFHDALFRASAHPLGGHRVSLRVNQKTAVLD